MNVQILERHRIHMRLVQRIQRRKVHPNRAGMANALQIGVEVQRHRPSMQEVADTGKTRSPSPLSETAAFLYGPPIRGARHGKR